MSENDAVEVSGARYKRRRESGAAGWAQDESYRRKAAAFDDLAARYGIPQDASVLELGCGAGNTTLHIAEQGFRAHGIDIVPEAIDWAKARAKEAQVAADFRVGSVAGLSPYEDASFDVIFDGDCLWMVLGDDRRACFAGISRTLKPGGVLYALAHLADPDFTGCCEIGPGAVFDPVTLTSTTKDVPMYQFSTEKSFIDEIAAAGLNIERSGTLEMQAGDGAKIDNAMPFAIGTLFVEARKP